MVRGAGVSVLVEVRTYPSGGEECECIFCLAVGTKGQLSRSGNRPHTRVGQFNGESAFGESDL
jgi:hypothetical protein